MIDTDNIPSGFRVGRDAEWHAQRRKHVCSTDAAAICGISPWKTAFEVALEKTGVAVDRPPSPEMLWGLRHEATIAAAYTEETGTALERAPKFLTHPHLDWMGSSFDFFTAAGDRIIEIKTAGVFVADEWGDPGSDDVPDLYHMQVQHEMEVAGIGRADVAVLIGGNDFRIYHLERNERLTKLMLGTEEEFWRNLQRGQIPDPDFKHRSTADLIAALYGVNDARAITLGKEEMALADRYVKLGAAEKFCKDARKEVKAQLLYRMGDAGLAMLPDGRDFTRKSVTVAAHRRKESTYVKFTVKQPKKAKVRT